MKSVEVILENMKEKGAVSSAEKGEKPEGTDGEEAFGSFSSLIKESKSSRDGCFKSEALFLLNQKHLPVVNSLSRQSRTYPGNW